MPTPVPVTFGGNDWRQVSAGETHTCATKTTGRLFCWGSDLFGELGNGGANEDQTIPIEVAGGLTTWRTMTVGSTNTCAIKTNGRLFCWGADTWGMLGDGNPGVSSARPVAVWE
jgi:alpha-tubulin suppressor-like RCC1 family protein